MYFQPGKQGSVGIVGPVSSPGMLVGVPIHVGTGPVNPKAVVGTTFYVLNNDTHYALIFGRTFLHDIEGLLDLKHHRLQYATAAGRAMATTIPLS